MPQAGSALRAPVRAAPSICEQFTAVHDRPIVPWAHGAVSAVKHFRIASAMMKRTPCRNIMRVTPGFVMTVSAASIVLDIVFRFPTSSAFSVSAIIHPITVTAVPLSR